MCVCVYAHFRGLADFNKETKGSATGDDSWMKLVKVALFAGFLLNFAHFSVSSCIDSFLDDDFDGIMCSNNERDLRRYLASMDKDFVKIHSPSILLKAISKGNDVAVDVLLSLGVDPFKAHRVYGMSAWDFVSIIPERELSEGQKRIKTRLKRKYDELPESKQIVKATEWIDEKIVSYFARFVGYEAFRGIAESKSLDIYNLTFEDGSKPIHQAILGNNFDLFSKLIALNTDVNASWVDTKGKVDMKECFGIDPIGWTPLMIAVSLNRIEMVQILMESEEIDVDVNINVKVGDSDVFSLARRLPVEKRREMLSLLKGKAANLLQPENCDFVDFKGAINSTASSECLNYFLNRNVVDMETFLLAVSYVNNFQFFKEILKESEHFFKTDKTIHKAIWAALKSSDTSITEFKTKISTLISFGFKIDDRKFHVTADEEMTPLEEAYRNSELNTELALGVVMNSSQINSIEAIQKAPIVLAMENNRVNIVKYLLKNAMELGLNYEIDCNEEKENLLHYAISWIENEEVLIKIVDLLLELNSEFLNQQSGSLVKNEISYDLEGKEVKYSMIKRSKWTPLMYAVMMRKNKVAKHLIAKGADREIKGWDDVNVDEVIKIRCDAYNRAKTLKDIEIKKRYNEQVRNRIVNTIKENFKLA